MQIHIVDDNPSVLPRLEDRLRDALARAGTPAEVTVSTHIWDLFDARPDGQYEVGRSVHRGDIVVADLYSDEWDESPNREKDRAEEAPKSPENIKRGALESMKWLKALVDFPTHVIAFSHVIRSLRAGPYPEGADEVEEGLRNAGVTSLIHKPALQVRPEDFDTVVEAVQAVINAPTTRDLDAPAS